MQDWAFARTLLGLAEEDTAGGPAERKRERERERERPQTSQVHMHHLDLSEDLATRLQSG